MKDDRISIDKIKDTAGTTRLVVYVSGVSGDILI